VLLGIVEGHRLLQVVASRDKGSEPEQAIPQGPMGLHEKRRVVQALGECEEAFSQLPCRLQLRLAFLQHPQSPQGCK
jgi:hypothetical protein